MYSIAFGRLDYEVATRNVNISPDDFVDRIRQQSFNVASVHFRSSFCVIYCLEARIDPCLKIDAPVSFDSLAWPVHPLPNWPNTNQTTASDSL